MQRADTLGLLKVILSIIPHLVAMSQFDSARYMLVYFALVMGEAGAYDYILRHAQRHYFIREDLLFPKDSPYYKVLETGNDRAFVAPPQPRFLAPATSRSQRPSRTPTWVLQAQLHSAAPHAKGAI